MMGCVVRELCFLMFIALAGGRKKALIMGRGKRERKKERKKERGVERRL